MSEVDNRLEQVRYAFRMAFELAALHGVTVSLERGRDIADLSVDLQRIKLQASGESKPATFDRQCQKAGA